MLRRFPTASERERCSLTLWTDSPALARQADLAGVDRIGPDFELLGKRERQSAEYRISGHSRDCLPALRQSVSHGALFTRTDPVNPGTEDEVEHLLSQGVDVLMVPMVRTANDVNTFNGSVAGRARVVLLLEHIDAFSALAEILAVPGTDEIHIGINDLALSIGNRERFSLLLSPLLDEAVEQIHAAGLPLGIAGIGRADDASLPVRPDLVYAELARLGATATLLARSFVRTEDGSRLTDDVLLARERLSYWRGRSDDDLIRSHMELAELVSELA